MLNSSTLSYQCSDHFRSSDLQLPDNGKHVHLRVLTQLLCGVKSGTKKSAPRGTVPTEQTQIIIIATPH